MNRSTSPKINLACHHIDLEQRIARLYAQQRENCAGHIPETISVIIEDSADNILIAKKGAFSPAPIYYTLEDCCNNISFSIKDVLAAYPHALQVCRQKIRGYLSYLNEIGNTNNLTYYQNIYRLLPGESIIVKRGEPPRFVLGKPIEGDKKIANYQEHLYAIRDRFVRSVTEKISSRGKMAANLSGGLDSTAVNSVARAISNDTILGLYVDTATTQADEFNFAEIVSRRCDIALRKLTLDGGNPLNAVMKCMEQTEMPETNNLPSSFNRAIIDACATNNIDVLLSGFLGDQVIDYGYGYYSELASRNEWQKLKIALESHGYSPDAAKAIILAQLVKQLVTSQNLFYAIRLLKITRKELGFDRKDLIREALRKLKHKLRSLSNRQSKLAAKLVKNVENVSDNNYRELDPLTLVKNHITLSQARIVGGVYQHIIVEALEQRHTLFAKEGIYVGYPFFDKELLEVTLHSTNEWKMANSKSRATLREALKEYLPREIYERSSKAAFDDYSCKTFLQLYDAFKEHCADNYKLLDVWQFVDRKVFEKLADDLKDNKLRRNKVIALPMVLTRVIYLGLWLKYLR